MLPGLVLGSLQRGLLAGRSPPLQISLVVGCFEPREESFQALSFLRYGLSPFGSLLLLSPLLESIGCPELNSCWWAGCDLSLYLPSVLLLRLTLLRTQLGTAGKLGQPLGAGPYGPLLSVSCNSSYASRRSLSGNASSFTFT